MITKLTIGSRNIDVDGVSVPMDTEAFIKDGRTFIPARYVAEAMGLKVEWDEKNREVTIYDRQKYFETEEAAVRDWCFHWHCYSMASAREISGGIFKCDKGYYWDDILIGQPENNEVAFDLVALKKGVALVHSHSTEKPTKADELSPGDIRISNKYKIKIYMVNSKGELYSYNPTDRKTELVYTGLPCDARHLDITKSAERHRNYFECGYFPLDEYKDGYKADYYNKLHMKGLSYLKEGAKT